MAFKMPMPDGPIASPSAWIGAEQRGQSDWIYELDPRDVDELEHAADGVISSSLDFASISPRNFQLPTLGPTLKALSRDVQFGRGFALIRGFPLEHSADRVERMYYGLMSHMGLPIEQNSSAERLIHVRNEQSYDNSVRSYKSNHNLTYHADWSDMVGLACIHPAREGGISRIISAVTVSNTLFLENRDVLEELYNIPFYMDWKGEGPKKQLPFYWIRIFSWFDGRFYSYYANRVICDTHRQREDVPKLTKKQERGLELIEEICQRSNLPLDMEFQPGDIQLLNNYTVWHSRTNYVDFDEPEKKRHLLRVWLAQSATAPLPPDFTNRYEMLGVDGVCPRLKTFPSSGD